MITFLFAVIWINNFLLVYFKIIMLELNSWVQNIFPLSQTVVVSTIIYKSFGFWAGRWGCIFLYFIFKSWESVVLIIFLLFAEKNLILFSNLSMSDLFFNDALLTRQLTSVYVVLCHLAGFNSQPELEYIYLIFQSESKKIVL